jgi:hypothetical protein
MTIYKNYKDWSFKMKVHKRVLLLFCLFFIIINMINTEVLALDYSNIRDIVHSKDYGTGDNISENSSLYNNISNIKITDNNSYISYNNNTKLEDIKREYINLSLLQNLSTTNNDLDTINNALSKSGLFFKRNDFYIKDSYDNTNNNINEVILSSDIMYSLGTDNTYNNNAVDLITNTMDEEVLNKLKVLGLVRYEDKTGWDLTTNSNDSIGVVLYYNKLSDSDVKYYIRYYIYNKNNSSNKYGPSINESVNKVFVLNYDFTSIMKLLSNQNIDKDKYPILQYLKESYISTQEKILNGKRKEQAEIFEEYSTLTSKNSFIQNEFNKYNNWIVKYKTGELVPEELNSYNTSQLKQIGIYLNILNESGIFSLELSELLKNNYLIDISNFNNEGINTYNEKDLLSTISEANDIASLYSKQVISDYTNLDSINAELFYDLIRYRYAKISGAQERSLELQASDQRIVNTKLEDILIDKSKFKYNIINPSLMEQLNKLPYFENRNFNYSDYLDLIASIQSLEYYTKDLTSSGISEEGINNLLEEAINNSESSKKYNLTDRRLIKWVKTYKQIKEGLDWLSLEPWTTELKYIYDKYKDISKFEFEETLLDYDVDSETEPLKKFFSVKDSILSKHYLTGVALSSTYIPMQTNLYDPTSIRILKDEEWLKEFHIKYGFHRKALMIDNNVNSAVDKYISGSRDTYRVATLNDLLQYNKDIVLYIDDNFYNVEETSKMLDKVYNRLSNTEQAGITEETFEGTFNNLFDKGTEDILKTGPVNKYNKSLIDNTTSYGSKKPILDWNSLKEKLFTDGLLMQSGDGPNDIDNNEIKNEIDNSEYSIQQSYAVVSGIYRHKELANSLNSISDNIKPVFMSSPALFNIQGVPDYEFNTIYNYYMLRNLKYSLGIDYKTTLDLDNPIYIDIYGNIITESGLVVIPAASNATLYPRDTYNPYNIGFMYLYSKGDYITTNNFNVSDRLNYFIKDENGENYLQRNYLFNDIPVNPQRPSIADSKLLEVLYNNQIIILNQNGYDFQQRVWLITEVLRGAPLENIDKVKEGIQGNRSINKYGLYMSYKLDELADMLLPTTNGNSIISMPNLSFIPGIEYIILFGYKAILLFFIIYIMYRIYIDTVGGLLGIKTFSSCVSTIVVFIICISLVPNIISMSYNETNKIFLQDEIKYLNLLNREKSLDGREISAIGVTEPKSQTKLYLKLDAVNIPWYKLLDEVMFSSVTTKLSELYEDELEKNILYGFEDVQVLNDGVYLDIQDIFDSSSIVYNNNQKFLYQNINKTTTSSYFIPYYYIMDNLLSSINIYNMDNGINNITTKIQSDGSVKTMGMIGDYLLSELFLLEVQDPLGLYELYGIDVSEKPQYMEVSYEDSSVSKSSMWFVRDQYSAKDVSSRIEQLYSYMRSYVAENRDMIGRVTDETFIKTMMLDISIKYNNIFKIPAAKGIEVFNIDSRDLIRLSSANKSDVIMNSSYSFGRFIYEKSSGIGVIFTAVLLGIHFITSIVKPALSIGLVSLLIYNLLIKRMIKVDKTKTIEGLLYLTSIMVVINSIYALLLKLSMSLCNFGLIPSLSIIAQIILQGVYLWLIYLVVMSIFKDFSNFGYNIFNTSILSASEFLTHKLINNGNSIINTREQNKYIEEAKHNNNNELKDRVDSNDLMEELKRRDNKRENDTEDTAFIEKIFNDYKK